MTDMTSITEDIRQIAFDTWKAGIVAFIVSMGIDAEGLDIWLVDEFAKYWDENKK